MQYPGTAFTLAAYYTLRTCTWGGHAGGAAAADLATRRVRAAMVLRLTGSLCAVKSSSCKLTRLGGSYNVPCKPQPCRSRLTRDSSAAKLSGMQRIPRPLVPNIITHSRRSFAQAPAAVNTVAAASAAAAAVPTLKVILSSCRTSCLSDVSCQHGIGACIRATCHSLQLSTARSCLTKSSLCS